MLTKPALTIDTAEVFEPLLDPARYKGAHGGRGSGKSHFFAGALVEDCVREPGISGEGMRAVCIREVQKSLKDSAKRLIEDKLIEYGLGEAQGFKVFHDCISTPKDGIINFQGMQNHTAESIKSLEGFKRAWCEEAQTISDRSLTLLRPTIRDEGSELWFSWNPRRKNDPADVLLRGEALPTGATVIEANWSDNPWFPGVLEQERLDCLQNEPDQYEHIWEGHYATVTEGAYYARQLTEARQQDRITNIAADPLLGLKAIWDIGGTGLRADATTIIIAQFIKREIRVVDCYKAEGQPLATHVEWLRSKGYENAHCILPHDGDTNDKVKDVSYKSALTEAGFKVQVVPNQGKGAAKMRIEAARRLFPSIWFNESTTEPLRDDLGWYHERKHELGHGLGPMHDESSHFADAFGLMCIIYEIPNKKTWKEQDNKWVI